MTFLIFTHVDPRDHVLVIEQKLRKSFCQFSLTDTGRTHKEERTDRPLLVGQSGPAAADSVSDSLNGLILTYHPLVQFALDAQKLLLLALKHLLYRDSGPLGDNLCDILWGNRLGDNRILDLGLFPGQLVNLLLNLGDLAVTELGYLAVVPRPFGCLGLDLVILDLLTRFLKA